MISCAADNRSHMMLNVATVRSFWSNSDSCCNVMASTGTRRATRAFVVTRLQMTSVYAGWRHQRSPCNNDCCAGSPLGCHNDRVRNHNVMPRDTMMMRVMTDAPTSDHVAIWYSMRGRGVGSGVVVTSTTKHICRMQLCKISQMWCATINISTDKTLQLQKHVL